MKQNERIIIISWVDDLIIVADKVISLSNVKKMLRCEKMSQKRYIGRVLERFDKSDCKPRITSCEQRMDLSNTSDPVDLRKYQEIVRSLIYLMTCTRPNLSYAVGKLLQHLSEPSQQQWVAADHILRYLRGTSQYNLCYKKNEELRILAYSDAD